MDDAKASFVGPEPATRNTSADIVFDVCFCEGKHYGDWTVEEGTPQPKWSHKRVYLSQYLDAQRLLVDTQPNVSYDTAKTTAYTDADIVHEITNDLTGVLFLAMALMKLETGCQLRAENNEHILHWFDACGCGSTPEDSAAIWGKALVRYKSWLTKIRNLRITAIATQRDKQEHDIHETANEKYENINAFFNAESIDNIAPKQKYWIGDVIANLSTNTDSDSVSSTSTSTSASKESSESPAKYIIFV